MQPARSAMKSGISVHARCPVRAHCACQPSLSLSYRDFKMLSSKLVIGGSVVRSADLAYVDITAFTCKAYGFVRSELCKQDYR